MCNHENSSSRSGLGSALVQCSALLVVRSLRPSLTSQLHLSRPALLLECCFFAHFLMCICLGCHQEVGFFFDFPARSPQGVYEGHEPYKSTFHWALQAPASFPTAAYVAHTHSGSVKPAEKPGLGQKLVFLFSLKISEPGPKRRQRQAFTLSRTGGLWDQGEKTHEGNHSTGQTDMRFESSFSYVQMPEHCSAFLWLLVTYNIFHRKRTATDTTNLHSYCI